MKYFIAVVQNQSYTKAAAECHISQSSISEQLKSLANKLGVQLIQRKGRSFELTQAGEFFYQHCQDIVRQFDQLVADTKALEEKLNNEYTLRLGYLRKFGSQEFLKAVAHFSDTYPAVNVKIHSGSYQELFKLVQDNELDLIFADSRKNLSPEYEDLALTQTDYMVVLSPKLLPKHQRSSQY